MPDTCQLKYQTSKTVNVDVLAIHGLAEPDHLTRFPGIVHEFLDGSLAEQNAGARRCGTIDFQVMSDVNIRKAVDWWNDSGRLVVSLVGVSGSVAVTPNSGGSLAAGTYYYEIRAIDVVGGGVTTTIGASDVSGGTQKMVVTWAAVSGARKYAIYRKKDAGHWFLIDYSRDLSYTDDGTITVGEGWDIGVGSPPAAADSVSIITDGDFELKWMYDTELARMLSVPFREATIFLKTAPFPV